MVKVTQDGTQELVEHSILFEAKEREILMIRIQFHRQAIQLQVQVMECQLFTI